MAQRWPLWGDSFAFGEEVSDEESLPFQLQNLLSDWHVINWAVPAFGHDQMLLRFKEMGQKKDVDLTVLIFLETDMYRNLHSFRDYMKPRFRLGSDELVLEKRKILPPDELAQQSLWKHWLLYGFWDLALNKLSNKYSKDSIIVMASKILNEFKKVSQEKGSEFIVVFAPQLYLDHENERIHPLPEKRFKQDKDLIFPLKEYLNEGHIDWIDIRHSIYSKQTTQNLYDPTMWEHWSPKINGLIAKEIVESLNLGRSKK
jgi:hypothetical protein